MSNQFKATIIDGSHRNVRCVLWTIVLVKQYNCTEFSTALDLNIEGWAQDYSNSNIFLKPLFRGNLDPFVNNANLGAIARTSNGT